MSGPRAVFETCLVHRTTAPSAHLQMVELFDRKQLHSAADSSTHTEMNLAKVHDRLNIKSFWEKRIGGDTQHAQSEEQRRSRSALCKLRGEWSVRLEARNKHLKMLNDNYTKKPAKTEQTV
uniref:Uncharacterized protein n=1 Tax=Knipowitschia caucasica TaxID=637954 RepID=A0AAV2MQ97_KNICA